jgi:hypothetical protein
MATCLCTLDPLNEATIAVIVVHTFAPIIIANVAGKLIIHACNADKAISDIADWEWRRAVIENHIIP